MLYMWMIFFGVLNLLTELRASHNLLTILAYPSTGSKGWVGLVAGII